MEPEDQSQVIRLGNKLLYPLSHLACPLALLSILLLLLDPFSSLAWVNSAGRPVFSGICPRPVCWGHYFGLTTLPSPFPALWSPPSISSSVQIQAPLNHTLSCFLCIPAKSESQSPNRAVWQKRGARISLSKMLVEKATFPISACIPPVTGALSQRFWDCSFVQLGCVPLVGW